MAITRGGTPVVTSIGTTVQQETNSDGTNTWPTHHNRSMSGGVGRFNFSTSGNHSARTVPGRLCKLHFPGTGGTLGNVTVYDNAAGDTSGDVLFGPTTPSAGQIIDIQAPTTLGIAITLASNTVGYLTYE